MQQQQLTQYLQNSNNWYFIVGVAIVVIFLLIVVALAFRARRQTLVVASSKKAETTPEKRRAVGLASSTVSHSNQTPRKLQSGAMSESRDLVLKVRVPQKTATIVKGNVPVATVPVSPNKAHKIHQELLELNQSIAFTLNDAVTDKEATVDTIAEVKKSLGTDVPLSAILASCIDIARSLSRPLDVNWMERELLGAQEWRDFNIVDVVDREIFPEYRLIDAKMYLNYTKEGESYPTIEEYAVPVFESRPIYLVERAIDQATAERADYIVFYTPAPSEWSSMASIGEFVPLATDIRDYRSILKEVKRRVYAFVEALE